jgi:hypothetical protein
MNASTTTPQTPLRQYSLFVKREAKQEECREGSFSRDTHDARFAESAERASRGALEAEWIPQGHGPVRMSDGVLDLPITPIRFIYFQN